MHALSSAKIEEVKPYALTAGQKALNDHFKRQRINAKAESAAYGFRARYPLPPKPPLVSLIIPTRNGLKLIKTCVESIFEKTTYPNYEIIIMDNGSNDPGALQYFDRLKKEKKVRVIRDDSPFNYSALNNKAVKSAKGKLVGLINNDLEVISPDWLSEMVSHALRPEIGAVGARLFYPDDTLQHGGVITGLGRVAGHSHKNISRDDPGYFGRAVLIQDLSVVTAACLVIRKSVYEEVNGLDEKKT
jgi:O-antigen biosynthesis protein